MSKVTNAAAFVCSTGRWYPAQTWFIGNADTRAGWTASGRPSHATSNADADAAEELNMSRGGKVLEVLRVCRGDGVPVVLERNHFSMAYAWLQDQDLTGSLYGLLREYGVEPKLALHDVSIRFAGEEEAKLLETEAGVPLIRLHEVIYDQRGRPLHNSHQLIRGDRFVFRI